MILTPKNWRDFQHYKDRQPPWIRLHRGLLDNKDFNALPPLACKVLVLLWLVAADNTEGTFSDNAEELAFRLRLPVKDVRQSIDQLLRVGFLQPHGEQDQEPDVRPLSKQIAEHNGFGSRHIADKTKRAVWERDGGKCCACQSTENLEYDHKHPVSAGGNSEEDNVQLLCRPCNRKKRTKTVEQPATPAQPWLDIRTTETEALQRTETETETETEQRQTSPSVAKATPAAQKAKVPTIATWEAYRGAYRSRYSTDPVRNAVINGQLSNLIARLGAEEAPQVAAFFVGHQNRLYVNAGHAVNLLLRDAEKLRTEWATGRQVTSTQAMQADRTQTTLNVFAPMLAEARAREAKENIDVERSAA